jgi:hypothetical protein
MFLDNLWIIIDPVSDFSLVDSGDYCPAFIYTNVRANSLKFTFPISVIAGYFLPTFSPDNAGLKAVAEPVIENRPFPGIGDYQVFDVSIIALVFRNFLAVLVKNHDHVILYPDDCHSDDRLNHFLPPGSAI